MRITRNFAQFLLSCLLVSGVGRVGAEVSVPSVFGPNMVLQREKPVPIWGWANPGEKVLVSFAGQDLETTANEAGRWEVRLKPMVVNDGAEMTIKGTNTLTFSNVAVGEVWFCSGQSNMAMFLADMGQAAVDSADDPQLRLYWVSSKLSASPLKDRPQLNWQPSNPRSAYKFSAQAHYFGRALRKKLNVPVGLMASAIGGSRIEPWIPAEVLAATPALADASARLREANTAFLDAVEKQGALKEWLPEARKAAAKNGALPQLPPLSEDELAKLPVNKLTTDKQQPSTLYNGLVNHLMGYAIRGVLWQQGFSNQADGYGYLPKIRALVDFWRERWGKDIPVYYVQYPSCKMITPEFREVQTAMLEALPNSAMVVCNDLSYDLDLHPKNKDKVGERLALLALANTYGVPMAAFTGPLYRRMKVEGDRVRVSFDQAGSGLVTRDGQPPTCFEIAAADGKYVPAEAEIDGREIVVRSPEIQAPARVRFAWDPVALPNLMNKEGLPASLFRSHKD